MEYLSKERYDQIVAELNTLTDVEYPRIKDVLWLRHGRRAT